MRHKARFSQLFLSFLALVFFSITYTVNADISQISPNFYDFGNITIGTESEPISITVTNTEDIQWKIKNVAIRGIHASNFQIVSDECSNVSILNPGDHCDIQVVMHPVEVGKVKAALKIVTDSPTYTFLYSHIVGIGRDENEPDINSNPEVKFNFGSTQIDSCENEVNSYPTQIFVISNNGNGSLKIDKAVIHGRNKESFVILSDNCSKTTIAHNETCNIEVSFHPITEGYNKAVLRIISNDPDEIPYRVKLTGYGIITDNPCEQNNPPSINNFTLSSNSAFIGEPIEFSYNVEDFDGDNLTCYIDYENDGTWDEIINNCLTGVLTHTYNIAGTFTILFKVFDGTSEISTTKTIIIEEVPSGSVRGVVKDAVTLDPIDNVEIEIRSIDTNSLISSGTTDSSGNFLIENIPVGNYKIIFTKDGYLQAYGYINIEEGNLLSFPDVLLINNSYSGNGSISGQVVNAIDSSGLSNVDIQIYNGIYITDNITIDPIYTTNTDSNGNYSITLPAGIYTVIITKEGFIKNKSYIVVLGNQSQTYNFTLSPILSEGEVRIVLTWGETPRDLDSHLIKIKNGSIVYHVYYGHRTESEAFLDVDDTSSYGPETITILNLDTNAKYIYKVHNYSAGHSLTDTTLAHSGAKVTVYWGEQVFNFTVPNEPGTVWTVFEINNGHLQPCTSNCFSDNI